MKANFCIIGSGVAGALVASELIARGTSDVLMVEAGGIFDRQNGRRWYDFVTAKKMPHQEHAPRPEEMESIGPVAYDWPGNQLLVRGGTTHHWEGWSYRFQPEDFEMHSRTGQGADWPISYGDLQPFYRRAETALRVCGDENDPGHPPRSSAFPLPPFPYQMSDRLFTSAMGELGYGIQHHCQARNTRPVDGYAQCQTVGTCTLCPFDAKFTGEQPILKLLQSPAFRLLTQTTALRLLTSSKKRASRLIVLDQQSGQERQIEAGKFIICGGGIFSPLLLLQSASAEWPQGLGNDHDQVGRYLTNHTFFDAFAGHTSNPDRLFNETGQLVTSTSRQFDSPETQEHGKLLIAHRVEPETDPVSMMASGVDKSTLYASTKGPFRHVLWLMMDQVPRAENRVELAAGQGRYGQARPRITFSAGEKTLRDVARHRERVAGILKMAGGNSVGSSFEFHVNHHMGTCRMSDSGTTGVVDANLRVHGMENVYLCSSAVFPTVAAAPPTLTISALALRLGEHLAPAPAPQGTRQNG